MPIRSYHCVFCDNEWSRIQPIDVVEDSCANCDVPFPYLKNPPLAVVVTEKVNKYWNKDIAVGAKEKAQERSTEHMREVEMHEVIAKQGIKNLVNHPLIKNGRIRKKGEV